MLNVDIIIILLSILTVVLVPLIRYILDRFKDGVFLDTKQVILDYYSSLDANIDHIIESNKALKSQILHLREIFELKIDSIKIRLEKLEKDAEIK